MKELTATEWKTLQAVVLRFAEEPFTAEGIEQAFPGGMTGFAAELGIERLRERGIVETRRKAWGETIHMLAPGLFADWQRCFVPGLMDALAEDEAVVPAYEPRAGFGKQLLFLLSEAVNVGLTLTQKGTFHKKEIGRLMSRIDVTEEELEGLEIAYLHQEKLGKPLAVLYDAALRLGLLTSGIGTIETSEERLCAWLDLSVFEADRRLQSLWWEVYTPADVWLQHGAGVLKSLPAGQWWVADRIADALLAAGVPTGERSEEEAREALWKYWIVPMAAFGWLELGEAAGRLTFRPAAHEDPEGETAACWYVQPDFEVVVPPVTPLRARWELEACAEYAGGDTVDRYKITKASWERALGRGRDPEQLINTLKGYAAYGMPEPVEASLRQWSAAYGAIILEDVTLLRCRDPRDAAFLRSDVSVADYLVAQVGELDFIVNRTMVKTLAETLKRQGFSLRTGGGTDQAPPVADSRTKPTSGGAFSGIVYSRRNAVLFPIDPAPPGTERLREKLDRVPQTWLRTLRKYHTSTVRELIETAIDIRTSVKVIVNGRTVELVPKRLQPMGADWVVQGYIDGAEATIASGACEEAQLLLPDQA